MQREMQRGQMKEDHGEDSRRRAALPREVREGATMMSCFNSVSLIHLCRRVPPPARLDSRGTRDGWDEGAGAGGEW